MENGLALSISKQVGLYYNSMLKIIRRQYKIMANYKQNFNIFMHIVINILIRKFMHSIFTKKLFDTKTPGANPDVFF